MNCDQLRSSPLILRFLDGSPLVRRLPCSTLLILLFPLAWIVPLSKNCVLRPVELSHIGSLKIKTHHPCCGKPESGTDSCSLFQFKVLEVISACPYVLLTAVIMLLRIAMSSSVHSLIHRSCMHLQTPARSRAQVGGVIDDIFIINTIAA
jgi:hypothetical protein